MWKKGYDKIIELDCTLATVDVDMDDTLSAVRIYSYDSNGTLIMKFSTESADYDLTGWTQLKELSGNYLLYFAGTSTTDSASGQVRHEIRASKSDVNFGDASYDPARDIYFGVLES